MWLEVTVQRYDLIVLLVIYENLNYIFQNDKCYRFETQDLIIIAFITKFIYYLSKLTANIEILILTWPSYVLLTGILTDLLTIKTYKSILFWRWYM